MKKTHLVHTLFCQVNRLKANPCDDNVLLSLTKSLQARLFSKEASAQAELVGTTNKWQAPPRWLSWKCREALQARQEWQEEGFLSTTQANQIIGECFSHLLACSESEWLGASD